MTKMNVAERIADLLVAEGVTTFFNLPEVSVGKLHASLANRGVRMIAPHHEATASFMAEGYTSVTGQFTFMCAACGPGVANLYSAVANAREENIPVLYIGTERQLIARNLPRSGKFQVSRSSVDVLRPITKFATIVEDPRLIDDLFQEAFRQLKLGTPGPVYIGLPFDMVTAEFDFGPLAKPQLYRPGAFADTFPDDVISRVVDRIRSAKHPVILGGSGIRVAGDNDAFKAFVAAAGCPVFLSPGGMGILPPVHQQLFNIGFGPGIDILNEADLIFAVGTTLGEKLGYGGNPNYHGQAGFPAHFVGPADRTWIVLDSEVENLGRNRPVDIALPGDLRIALPKLTRALEATPPPAALAAKVEVRQNERRAYYAELFASAPDVSPIHMGALLVEVQKALPSGTLVVLDGGTSRPWAQTYLYGDYADILKPMKSGNLGIGFSYAIGASAAGTRSVCVIGGDGSHGFYPMELETAVRYKFPIIHVVTYDQGWGLEEPYYLHMTGKTFEVDTAPVRLDEFARAFGAHGEYCDRTDQILPAMQRALASGKPAIIQIVIDRKVSAFQIPNNDVWTKWHSDRQIY